MQLDLFANPPAVKEPPLYASADPSTSKEAADKLIASGALNRQFQEVLDALVLHGPCTAVELSAASGIERYTCSRRLPDLLKRHKVESLAPRVCRVAGTKQLVWRALPPSPARELAGGRE